MLFFDEFLTWFLIGNIQFNTYHEASSSNFHNMRNLCFTNALHQVFTNFGSILDEFLALHNLENCDGSSTSKMVSTEGRSELTINRREFGTDEETTHGESIADSFRDSYHIGTNSEMLMSKEFAASSVATLNLVANQDGSVSVAQFLKFLQEIGFDQANTTHSLYAFQDASADISLLEFSFPSLYIVER